MEMTEDGNCAASSHSWEIHCHRRGVWGKVLVMMCKSTVISSENGGAIYLSMVKSLLQAASVKSYGSKTEES